MAMATDTELLDMAVDNEGLGAGPTVDKSHMQELEMFRILFSQMSNPDHVPETQDSLMRKHRVELDSICAKRQNTPGWLSEERDEESDRPETPRAVPHGHVESHRPGRGQF